MAEFKYNIEQLELESLNRPSKITKKEQNLIGTFEINNLFTPQDSNVELSVYGVDNTLLDYIPRFLDYTLSLNAQSAGKSGASILTLNPEGDIKTLGYDTGDVRLLYRFTNNLFSEAQIGGTLFIDSISPDGTEIRALSTELTDEQIVNYTNKVKAQLSNPNHFSEFQLNFGEGKLATGLNIDTEETPNGTAVVFKLYEAVTLAAQEKFSVEESISDDILYEISATVTEDDLKVPKLKGPNFGVEFANDNNQPTEFLNYNELFSYPVSNSYFELYSLFSEKSAQIAIDHSKLENFIHYSSAEERVRNFHYKLQLIESYESSINTLNIAAATPSGSLNKYLTSNTGSVIHYENLIKGIVDNFDHYDRYLYFESGSTAWPKSTTKKPHINLASTHPSASSWFDTNVEKGNLYDVTNFDILTNTIPTYIREDSNNEQYLMFTHMIAHHFDNLWVYFRAVSDKYDTDHRLNFGVSKDLVRDAIESFGTKLYNSNQNIDNLFAMFIGENPSTDGERIVSTSIATSASLNSGSTALEYMQPVAKNNYEKEVYKRIYHNLSLINKTKGTERGLRALINCFGIPREILSIKTFGGSQIDQDRFYGPEFSSTSSMYPTGSEIFLSASHKLRNDNTGSIVTGSTLSRYTSIIKPEKKYTDDLPHIEVGFNISRGTDEFIDLKVSSSFNMDDYIGDPRERYSEGYPELTMLGEGIVNDAYNWEDIQKNWEAADFRWNDVIAHSKTPRGLIRLLNFFDSSIFRLIKDFVPARAKVDTGVIIKSHKLARSKAKQVKVSWEDLTLTSSIAIASIKGGQGGSFDEMSTYKYTTNHSSSVISPIGEVSRNVTDESPTFTGEFSGSLLISTDGEVSKRNTFKKINQPNTTYQIIAFNLSVPLPPGCIISLTGSYQGEYTQLYTSGSGTVGFSYPIAVVNNSSSVEYSVLYDEYEFLSGIANTGYGNIFRGWYTDTSGTTLVTDQPALTIYYIDEAQYGNKYYAHFEDTLYHISASGAGQLDITYPGTGTATPGSPLTIEHDFETYSTYVLEATPVYPQVFDGWFNVPTGGTAISTSSTLTVDKAYTETNGRTIYGRFS